MPTRTRIGDRAHPTLSLCLLVEGYYWAANSAPGGASRRPCRVLQHDQELRARLATSRSLLITPLRDVGGALAPQRKTRRFTGDREFGVATATVFGMRPRARFRPTVRPVQRSNGVSPTPNPRGVEGRDLLLWQGQRLARTKVDTHHIGLRGWTSLTETPVRGRRRMVSMSCRSPPGDRALGALSLLNPLNERHACRWRNSS